MSEAMTTATAEKVVEQVEQEPIRVVVAEAEAQAAAVALTAMRAVGMYDRWHTAAVKAVCGYTERDMCRTLARHAAFHQTQADQAEALSDAMPRYPHPIMRAAWCAVHPQTMGDDLSGIVKPEDLNDLVLLCLDWVCGEELPAEAEEGDRE